MSKDTVMQIRIDSDLKHDFYAACEKIGLKPADINRMLIQAWTKEPMMMIITPSGPRWMKSLKD